MFTYVCTKGHIAIAPTAGDLASCPELEACVTTNGRVVGRAPCGCGVVKVPEDPGLVAAFKLGGSEAVLAMIRDRIASQAVLDRLPA